MKRLLAMLLVCGLAQATECRLSLAPEAPRHLKGWGIMPFEIPPENPAERETMKALILRDLSPTLVKLLIRPGTFDDSHPEGGLNEAFTEKHLLSEIRTLLDCGVAGYITSADTPPPSMKRFQAVDGHVDLKPNHLRPEAYLPYARHLVSVFQRIRKAGLPLPLAHSLQNGASLRLTQNSCPYSPEQWSSMAGVLRRELDLADLGSIRILGPDTVGAPETLRFTPDGKSAFHDLAFQWLGAPQTASLAQLRSLGALTTLWHQAGMEVWQLGYADYTQENERNACLQTAQTLTGHLSNLEVDYWFFKIGYRSKRGGEVLASENAQASLTHQLLSTLWRLAPAGAELRRTQLQGSPSVELGAIGFRHKGTLTLLLYNASTQPHKLQLDIPCLSHLTVAFSLSDNKKAREHFPDQARLVDVEPQEVIIVTGQCP